MISKQSSMQRFMLGSRVERSRVEQKTNERSFVLFFVIEN